MIGVAILALVVAGTLISYLLMVSSEHQFVMRSQNWNNALYVAESGMEEGMALLNVNIGMVGPTTNWIASATANGWSIDNSAKSLHWQYNGATATWQNGTNGDIYHIRRYLDSTNGYYDVYINSTTADTNGPEILAIGTAFWNSIANPLASGPSNVVAAIKGNAVRKVYMRTINDSQLGNDGLIGNALTFHGNNVTIDSFDSSDPKHSIWHSNLWFHGANYGTWTNNMSYNSNTFPCYTANVHVAAETNYIDVGNANIYGYINTAPGGTYNLQNNGSVGDLNWVHNGTPKLQPGHFKDDMNQSFVSRLLPTPVSSVQPNTNWLAVTAYSTVAQTNGDWSWVLASSTTHYTNVIRIGGVYSNGIMIGAGTLYTNIDNAGWVLPNGSGTTSTYAQVIPNRPEAASTNNIYYSLNSLNGNIYVDCQYGVLYLTNGMSSPTITLNTNADLTIYSTGDITFGTTVNNSALARALTICDVRGHPIQVTASGNASGVSKIYIPSSSIKLNGSGKTLYDIIGEITCNSADFNGHFNLHFDESLTTNSPSTQFVSSLWREVQ